MPEMQRTYYKQHMKAGKPNNLFSNKLSVILSKFKESTTVHVGHEQARALFNEFALRDILTPFLSKMDNCDHLSDRQRKEYSKTYLTLVDAYKEEILAEAHYERILESLNRKTGGVSQVVGHICKTLLNRIQDLQQLYPYVSALLNIFHGHPETSKIFRQIIETIDCNIISSLQDDILSVLIDRIPNAKIKSEYLEAVQALVLCLQEKLTAQPQVVGLLLKYLRSDDWNCRKTSVEIAYALLVINQEIKETLHSTIKELKYDKIKHVRDSVNNYQALYKQIYAEELAVKVQAPSVRQTKINSDYAKKTNTRSPAPIPVQKESREARQTKEFREPRRSDEQPNSLEKSTKFKQKNENFFKNAKNSDVIRTNEDNRNSLELQREDHRQFKDQNSKEIEVQLPIVKMEESAYYDQKNNFQAYLKKRTSPSSPPISKSPIAKTPPIPTRPIQEKKIQKFESIRSSGSKGIPPKDHNNRFNYESELQTFKKKNKISEIDPIHYQQSPRQSASFGERSFDKSQQEFSISYIENGNEQTHLDQFKSILLEFEKRINSRLDRLEKRIDMIEDHRIAPQESLKISKSSRQLASVEVRDKKEKTGAEMQAGRIHPDSPQSYLYNQSPNDSKLSYSECQGVESNLEQKVKASIVNENWDEAFTLALTNNRKNILLNLLQRCVFPQDRTVQQCIVLQLRKLLDYSSALKWLKYYLIQRQVPRTRLLKLRQQLQRKGVSNNKNFEMMRQLVLQEIADKLQSK